MSGPLPDLPRPEVTVALPLYDDAQTIGDTLEALAAQTGAPPFEVVVVDDGSRDAGPEIARRAGARVVRQANAGPGAARNRGAREARAPIVLFLDADCRPPPDWVREMTAPFADPSVDAVMGAVGSANSGVVPAIVQLEIEERYEGMRRARDRLDFVAAPACGFRRDVFLSLGGFDERLRQAEDVEIGYRFSGAGRRIVFVDSAPVAHAHQTRWPEFLATKHRRALGRMQVFDLHPDKRRHDSWTPLSLKLQFALALVAPPLLLAGLLWPPLALGGLLALLGVAALAAPLIGRVAGRLGGEVGRPRAVLAGLAFVYARAWIIAAAVARLKLRALSGAPRLGPRQEDPA